MREYEREHDIEPDWNVHAFQKAQAIQGQQSSVATEYVIRMLGLDICADTICGNHMMRGISGGQKKRVTSGQLPSTAWHVTCCVSVKFQLLDDLLSACTLSNPASKQASASTYKQEQASAAGFYLMLLPSWNASHCCCI